MKGPVRIELIPQFKHINAIVFLLAVFQQRQHFLTLPAALLSAIEQPVFAGKNQPELVAPHKAVEVVPLLASQYQRVRLVVRLIEIVNLVGLRTAHAQVRWTKQLYKLVQFLDVQVNRRYSQCTEAAVGIHGALPPMPSRQKGNIDRKRQVARVDFRNGSTAGLSKFYGMYRFSRPVSLDQSG